MSGRMSLAIAYKALCWLVGALMLATALALLGASVLSVVPGSSPPFAFPIGPQGYYFVAFSGTCLLVWALCLFGAARGLGARAIGTATALGLTLGAAHRLLVWLLGEVWWVGATPRIEAIAFLVVALAFLWLRPGPAVLPDRAVHSDP